MKVESGMEKSCLVCRQPFSRPRRVSYAQFEKRRSCSKVCGIQMNTRAVAERFWEKVAKGEGCWTWTGSKVHVDGYGQFRLRGRRGRLVLAHRFSFELENGPIPDGLEVCHRCDNRPCVRPEHLFIGTRSDNMKDCALKGRNFSPTHLRDKTHCPSGHPYAGENLYVDPSGARKCRICSRAARMRSYYAKKRA